MFCPWADMVSCRSPLRRSHGDQIGSDHGFSIGDPLVSDLGPERVLRERVKGCACESLDASDSIALSAEVGAPNESDSSPSCSGRGGGFNNVHQRRRHEPQDAEEELSFEYHIFGVHRINNGTVL